MQLIPSHSVAWKLILSLGFTKKKDYLLRAGQGDSACFPTPLSQARASPTGPHSEPTGSRKTCWEVWSQRKPQRRGNWMLHLSLFKPSPASTPLSAHGFWRPVTSWLSLVTCHLPHNSLLENSKIQDRHTHSPKHNKGYGMQWRVCLHIHTPVHIHMHAHTHMHTQTYAHEGYQLHPAGGWPEEKVLDFYSASKRESLKAWGREVIRSFLHFKGHVLKAGVNRV